MKKIINRIIFTIFLIILSRTAFAQIPILYYDFENNSDRSSFENAVESQINSGSDALEKFGGHGSALHIADMNGAGLFNLGASSGQAITTQQGGWDEQTSNPGTGAEYYYQFTVNTFGFSGISVSYDNYSDEDGPARTGVLFSGNGVNFTAASTSPVLTGNGTFKNSGLFSLPSGADNWGTITIRIYAYSGSEADRTGRDEFSSHGKFGLDNVTVFANSIITNAGTKALLSESNIYTCVKSGSIGGVIPRNSWTINSGASAVLSSDFSLASSQTLSVLSGGQITFGANSLLESAAATFTLASGSYINIGSANGITSSGANGNVQTTVRNFNTGAYYTYNGSAAQFTGNGLPSTVSNLIINNSSGVTMNSDISVSGVLTLTSGNFSIAAKTLTIGNAIQGTRTNLISTISSNFTIAGTGNGIVVPASLTDLHNLTINNNQAAGVLFSGDVNINSGTVNITGLTKLSSFNLKGKGISILKGSSAGKLSLAGNLSSQITGFTTNTFGNTDGGTYSFSGTSVQTIPAGTYSNLQTANSAGVNLDGTVIVTGTVTLSGPLNIGAATLNISNPFAGTTSNLTGTANSNLIVSGFMPNVIIPSSLTVLNNLNISNNQIVTLAGNLNVNGTLTLEQNAAFLNTGSNTLTIGSGVSNPGEIIRNGGSIRGTIKRWFGSGAALNKVFPLDNGSGAFSQAKISFTSVTTGGTLTASFHNSGSGLLPAQGDGNYIPAPEMHVNLINLAPQYWTITAGDGLAGFNYNLELTGDGIPNVSNINYITIVKRHDSTNPWAWNYSNFIPTTGTTTNPVLYFRNGTSFSDFGVGGNVENLLPVELASFTSSLNGRNVNIAWVTNSEENNSGFDVERKSEITDWVKAGTVAGHGNSNVQNSYSFLDVNLSSGKYKYRLKQTDFNGNFHYYDLANEVIIGAPKNFVLSQNYPNPFNPKTVLSYQLPVDGFISLKVYDVNGKEVVQLVNEVQQAGYYAVDFNAASLSSGTYFYTIQAGDFKATKRMLLVK